MTELPTNVVAPGSRDRVIWALRRAEIAVQNMKDRRLRAVGMAASHYALLVSVDAEPGLAGATLARRLHVTPQAIASLVSRLEGRGWVERRPHPRHTQVQELHLTDDGRRALAEADEIMEQIESEVVGLLGRHESQALRSVLEGLAGRLPLEG